MIDTILSLEKPLMLFFQNMRNNFLCSFAEIISFLGETVWSVIFIFFIYLCMDKRKGFALGAVTMTSHFVNGILKSIFRIPRPWVKYPDEIVPLRQSTATGYSFPSGHSSSAGSLYGSAYRLFSSRILRSLCIILIVLIPFSRIYLGVHWPLDVIFGLALGLAAASFAERFQALYDRSDLMRKINIFISPLVLICGLADAILIDCKILDKTLWKDLSAASAALTGVFLAGMLEKRYVSFKIPQKRLKALVLYIIDVALGSALTILWTGKIETMHYVLQMASYITLITWVIFICPLIYVKLGLYEREES